MKINICPKNKENMLEIWKKFEENNEAQKLNLKQLHWM